MSDPLKKVQSGDPLVIPAATFNTFIDAARAHLDGRQNAQQTPKISFRQSGIVTVKKPAAVYVEKVYEEGDFAGLGIGTS